MLLMHASTFIVNEVVLFVGGMVCGAALLYRWKTK